MTVSVQGTGGQTVVFQTRKITGDDLETNAALLDLDDIPMPTGVVDSNNATYTNFTALYADLPFNQNLKGPEGPQGPAIDTVSLSQSVDLSTVTMAFTYVKDGQSYNISTTPTFTIPAGPKGDKGDQGNPGTNGTNGTDGNDGVGITAVNQPTSTTINFSLSDGTTTSDVTLPGGGGGSGTVTSVGITGSNGITVSGSPVTASGTIGVSLSLGANLTYNTVTQQIDATDTDTTYSVADANNDGLMSSSDFSKLSGIAAQANKYVLPAATTTDLGGIKVGTNLSITQDGTLSATDTDTTYSVADAQTDGLMSSSDFSKLGTVESNARALPSYTNNGGKVLSLTSGASPALQWEDRPEVSISGTTNYDYISLNAATQVITINQVDLAADVTGTLPSTNLSTNLNAIDGLTNTDGYFIVGSASGWVVEKDSTVRTSLGLGSIATQAANAVNIDGGAIDGVTIGTNAVVTDLRVDNLQLDGNTISSTDTNGNLALSPNGTGNVSLGNFTFDADQTVGASEDDYILRYNHSNLTIGLEALPAYLTTVDLTTNVGSTVLPYANGGTGLSALGSAGQVLKVNSAGTALEYATDNTGAGVDPVVMALALG